MSEAEMIGWVVKAIVVLVGLYFVIYNPMKKSVEAMTKLTCSVDELSGKLVSLESKNAESHRRLWKEEEKQNTILNEHERRLHDIDGKWSESSE